MDDGRTRTSDLHWWARPNTAVRAVIAKRHVQLYDVYIVY